MSTNWVNFAEIRQKVSLEDVLLRYYQLDGLKRTGNKVTGPCPVHGGKNPRAFHADLTKNVWHCFTGCASSGGNQLDLVARREGISVRDAALALQRFLVADGGEVSGSAPSAKVPEVADATDVDDDEEAPQPNPVLELEIELKTDHPHLTAERGLTPETIEIFGVGYAAKGTLRGCIAIPIHNEAGQLVAYAGRRLREKTIRARGKYVFPKGFRKELELYHYHQAKAVMDREGLVLVEGFFSVMALVQAGIASAVAAMGTSVSQAQLALLAEAPEVVVMFDGDKAGAEGTRRTAEKLQGKTTVRTVALADGLEPESLSPRALRWVVRGMRELDLAHVALTPRDASKEQA